MFGRSFIPNALTSANLFFGCLALIQIFEGNLEYVIYYVFLSGIADFFDGFAARMMKSTSMIGKDLDSLADMVSFSLVPAFLMYKMIEVNTEVIYLPYVAFIIAIFSALRLAKFNNDTRQSDSFYGLPVPANALFLCTLPLFDSSGWVGQQLSNPYIVAGISVVMASLLITDVKLIALKFKNFAIKGNEARYLVIVVSLIAIATYQFIALPFIVIFYFVTSIFVNMTTKKG
ncbi:MAG: CDP-diacylglycerol--serine O-phosphatidyltransferase [Reichenbachiella sp.]